VEVDIEFEIHRAKARYDEALGDLERAIASARRELALGRAPSVTGVLHGTDSRVEAAAGAYSALLRAAGRG
jgi:hypothetical protein